MTQCDISERRCQPCEGGVPPLGDEAVAGLLDEVKGWSLEDGKLQRRYIFRNHYEAMAFANAVAWVSHRENHHPEMVVGYKEVRVLYWTHAVDGLTNNDFICAAKLDKLFDF